MTIKQISTVAFDNLPASEIRWLDEQDPALFVEITDGDESLQRGIQPVALSEEEALASLSERQRIIYGEKPHRAPAGCRPVKAYYSGEYAYEREE